MDQVELVGRVVEVVLGPDVAEATMLALERDNVEGWVINVSTMDRTSVNDLCGMFIKLVGKPQLKPVHEAARPGEIKHSQADISRAGKLLGFRPKVSIERGVEILWKNKEAR